MRTIRKGCRGADVKILQRALHLIDDGIFGNLTDEAVRDFQKANSLVVDGVVGDKTWDALNIKDSSSLNIKTKRKITELILHCTASREGVNQTVSSIRNCHIRDRKWSDIGYHFVIYLDGSIHKGRPLDKIGAHCSGHNSYSIGICYVGGLDKNKNPKDTRTDAQKKGLLELLTQLKKQYPNAKIIGHRDTSPDLNGNGTVEPSEWIKSCPCFDATKEYSKI